MNRVKMAYILVFEVLEQLELAVCSLGEDRGAEWLHDLFDSNGLAGQLILSRATQRVRLNVRKLKLVPEYPQI